MRIHELDDIGRVGVDDDLPERVIWAGGLMGVHSQVSHEIDHRLDVRGVDAVFGFLLHSRP